MKTWQKVALVVLIPAAILAIGIWRINVSRRSEPVAVQPRYQEKALSQDEMVVPRKLFIDDLKSARALDGKPVWMAAGYELPYFPYAGHRIELTHRAGVIPAAQQMDVKDVVTQDVPASVETRMPSGKQGFLVFTMPGSAKEYAVAMASYQGSDSTWYCDKVLYYDDPHKMYGFWPADVWKAIDQHHPIAGMNELQTSLALGVMQQSDSSDYGNRTVDYDAGGPTGP